MLEAITRKEAEMSDIKTMRKLNRTVIETGSPKFREHSELSTEQLTDPDYRLKQLEKLNEGKLPVTCSKCHHCR